MRKTVLDLSSEDAREFFTDPKMYLTIDLPSYYNFEQVLTKLATDLSGKEISFQELVAAKKAQDVNYIIYGNKRGKYEWRKLELINPYLYISLVNALTEQNSWREICDRFHELSSNNSIICMSVPVSPDSDQRQKASQINEWVDTVERESIRLALDFEYLFQTDIVDCYGSIYTHSIAWALHSKETAKIKRSYNQLLGNKIDWHLQAMSYGQTNGIPQGSVLMDFIAEIVLAYADNELSKKIEISKDEYRILRYRDDYRIFVCNPYHGDTIMKALSETLSELGMNLNTAKTIKSENIVIDAIKPDKIATLYHPVPEELSYRGLRNELIMIYQLGVEFPSCGSIVRRLTKINDIVSNELLISHSYEFVSILGNIAIRNQNAFPIVSALISRAIVKISKKDRVSILDKLIRKIHLMPKSGLLEIWIQRITLAHNLYYDYNERLCDLVNDDNISIFNSTWVNSDLVNQIMMDAVIVDHDRISKLDEIIGADEVNVFRSIEY